MRSLAFNLAFGLISVFHTLWAALAALTPGRGRVRAVVHRYVRRMVWAMDVFAGIRIEVRGRERLPTGAFILAPKHASYGDGFSIYAQFDDLAFVTGDHLERFPLFKTVLKKLGAIVVDSCGGPEARRALTRSAAEAHAEGRKILIYPEGALAPVGEYFRYRTGVFHMARDFDVPVVPVASSLGRLLAAGGMDQEARHRGARVPRSHSAGPAPARVHGTPPVGGGRPHRRTRRRSHRPARHPRHARRPAGRGQGRGQDRKRAGDRPGRRITVPPLKRIRR